MSVLLVDPPAGVGQATVRYLIDEGDEVRVLVGDRKETSVWKSLGAYVAAGDPTDQDLVERACQNVRTVVVFSAPDAAVVSGARTAGVGRLISVTRRDIEPVDDLEHVVLVIGARGWWSRARCSDDDVAAAISAADDLASIPNRPVYLSESEGREALRLSSS